MARAYGLPAVMTIRDALVRIRSGQTVTGDQTLRCVYPGSADDGALGTTR